MSERTQDQMLADLAESRRRRGPRLSPKAKSVAAVALTAFVVVLTVVQPPSGWWWLVRIATVVVYSATARKLWPRAS